MNTPFDPSKYHDEYQNKLKELIEAKIAGKEIVADKSEQSNNVINLMDALKASVEKAKPAAKAKKTTKPAKKEKGA